MDAATALVKLKRIVGSADPVIPDDDLEAVLADYRLKDSAGLAPGAAGYAGTYDIDQAAAEVFEMKANRCADWFTVDVEGRRSNFSDVRKSYLELAEHYRNKQAGSVMLAGRKAEDDGEQGIL